MNISESIDEIVEKNQKERLTYIFGVLPLIGLIVFIFIYESQIIKTERKYATNLTINSESVSIYKLGSEKNKKIKNTDIIANVNLGEKIYLVDSVNSNWFKVLYSGDTGLIKAEDGFIEKKLVNVEKISRFSLEKNIVLFSFGLLIFLLILLIIYLDRKDKKRRTVKIFYEENKNLTNFNEIFEQAKSKIENNFIWLINSEATQQNLKKNSGANTVIDRTEILLNYNIFPFKNIECNINVPGLVINDVKYCFYPDALIKIKEMKVDIIKYSKLKIRSNQSTFIESQKESENFTIQGYTYQFTNKDGSPDRRHSHNPRYPICIYSNYEILYENEVLFKLMCSNSKILKLDTIIDPIDNNVKDENQFMTKEYFTLIDDLKIQLNQLFEVLNRSIELKELINKHSGGSALGNIEAILQYCILFDISKIYSLFFEKFGENNLHKLTLIVLSSNLMGEDLKNITELSNESILKMLENGKYVDLIETYSAFGKKNNPINDSLNIISNKKESDFFSLPSILRLSKSEIIDSYSTFLYQMATVLTKSDNVVTNDEESVLKSLYKILNPKGTVKSKKEKLEKSSPMNTLEDSIKELDNLIGLEDVKKEVNSLVNFVNFQKNREKHGLKQNDISYHCVFTGAPGTGKTTVARILATIFKSLEVIDKGHLIETDRSGMIAEYVGQTAVKVDKLVNDALGGILFIDEAYSLSTDSSEDFGKEAIASLLKRMEDNRDNLIVIVAGYTDKMKDFIDMNPGLKSRFNRYIQFDDYSPSELVSIFKKMCDASDYILKPEAEHLLVKQFTDIYESRDESFGNGRFVRNMFEKTIENLSNRISKSNKITKELLTIIEKEDLLFL